MAHRGHNGTAMGVIRTPKSAKRLAERRRREDAAAAARSGPVEVRAVCICDRNPAKCRVHNPQLQTSPTEAAGR